MNKKKIILIAVAVVAVAGISIRLFGGSTAKHKVTYETATVIKGEISESITATGTIEPVTEVEVGTQVSGIIDKIYADYNSVVTKGQLIAEMDRVTLQSEVASQRAPTTVRKPNTNISGRTTNATGDCTKSSLSAIPTTSSPSTITRKRKAATKAVRHRWQKRSATCRTPPSLRPSTAWSSTVR